MKLSLSTQMIYLKYKQQPLIRGKGGFSLSLPTRKDTKALKEIEKLKKTIAELDGYERETLYPLATQKIEIDLDDGVKVNYPKFGKALKKVTGLN